MVTGIDSFKEWFKGSEEQYAIIGGTACDILMTEDGLDFRATKDKLVVNHIIIQHPSVVSFPIFNIGHFTPTIFDVGRSEDE